MFPWINKYALDKPIQKNDFDLESSNTLAYLQLVTIRLKYFISLQSEDAFVVSKFIYLYVPPEINVLENNNTRYAPKNNTK